MSEIDEIQMKDQKIFVENNMRNIMK